MCHRGPPFSGEPLLPDVPQTTPLPHYVALAATQTTLTGFRLVPPPSAMGTRSPASFGQVPKGRGGFAHLAGPG
jgi:hypothetical protein